MLVDLVNVNVFVTDKRGNPITDLKREDFSVFEDGEAVSITNFYAVEGGVAAPSASVRVTEPGSEEPTKTPFPAVAATMSSSTVSQAAWHSLPSNSRRCKKYGRKSFGTVNVQRQWPTSSTTSSLVSSTR